MTSEEAHRLALELDRLSQKLFDAANLGDTPIPPDHPVLVDVNARLEQCKQFLLASAGKPW